MEKAFEVVRDVCIKKTKVSPGNYRYFYDQLFKINDLTQILFTDDVKNIRKGVWTGKEQKVNQSTLSKVCKLFK